MTIMLDILVEHLEEIEFLWAQRTAAIRSPDYREHEIQELDDRIDAHLQGLVVGGAQCVQFAEPMLGDDDPYVAFAGAWCLAKLELFQPVLDQLPECNLDGVAMALCQSSIDGIQGQLQKIYRTAEPRIASAVGLVLATHQKSPSPSRSNEFFSDQDPDVRRRAWETVSRSCKV